MTTPAELLDLHAKLIGIAYGRIGTILGSVDREIQGLHRAELFLITEEMGPLVEQAALTLPEISRFAPEDLIAPRGVMLWDGLTCQVGDESAHPLLVTWETDQEGVGLYGWHMSAAGQLFPLTAQQNGWKWGDPFYRFGEHAGDWEPIKAPLIWLVTMRLMRQTIIQSETARLPRHALRRAHREGRTPDITVTRLRHVRHVQSGGLTSVEWASRWLVRGHWRNQWVPSLDAHRPTWIAPHVKGPEDKPLVVRPRVTVLDR